MTTTTTDQSTEAPVEQLHDVLIKTVVNVKLRHVPAATPEQALERAEQAVDFNVLFQSRRAQVLQYKQLPEFPRVAYTEWAEESVDALVDPLDADGELDEEKSVYYEMRVDPDTGDGLEWRRTTYAAQAFVQKLAELRERYGREDASGGETPAFDGNDEEIDFLRELVELAANCGLR